MSGNRRTIGNTFVVTTMEDPVSVVAQYAPNNNPSNSQIHTTFQSGDLFMRTRNTDESFSGNVDPNHPWNRIVGEAGDETDYTFAISAKKTTSDASTSPTDIGANDWSDAPVATTQAKPYLWSRVRKKVWDETQTPPAYVVQSTRYVRLTGEGGDEYIIESTQGSVVIESNQTTGTLSGVTLSFFRKEGGKEREAYSCFCTIFRKKGSTYTVIKRYATAGAAVTYTHTTGTDVPALTADNYDAVVVCIYNAASTSHSGYLAELEIPVRKNGDSPFVVDLDNEMTNVAVDGDNKLVSAADIYFEVRAFIGTTNVIADCTVTPSCSNTNITPTYDSTTHKVSVQIAANTQLSDTTTISIQVVHSSYGTRTLNPIIAAVKGGKNAVLQELLPSINEISFARQSDGTLSPSSRSLSISFKKTDGGTATIQSIGESGLTVRWSESSMPSAYNAGYNWGDGTPTGITWNNITMQIASSIAYTNIYIAAFKQTGESTYVLVDRETIPIIKDGKHGDNAPYVELSRTTILYEATNAGASSSSQDFPVSYAIKIKGVSLTVGDTSSVSFSLPSGITVKSGTKTTSGVTFNVESGASPSGVITVTIYGTDSNNISYNASASITVEANKKGADAPNAFATPAQISIPCYSNGNVKAQKVTSVLFSLKVGTNTATVTSCAEGTKPTGVTVQGQADNAVTITVGTSATASGLSAGVTFTVTGTYGGKTYSATVTVALIGSTQGEQGNPGSPGNPGARGKIGRSYYYATEWNPSDNTTSFLVNDTQAPYFSNAGSNLNKYYAYNAKTNGYYTMSQMAAATTVGGSIDWNSEPWSLMTDDFKYIITEALFTKFAKLGSAIFNEDFMYSKYLNNELSMYYSYSGQSISRSLSSDYALVVSQTSLPVIEGKQYKVSITCYHNSGYSDALYSRVFYNTKSDWSGSLSGSSAFISVSSNTSATYDIDFVAIQTGYVRIYNVGYGTITKIVASQSESYENVSPMFINTDDVPLLPAGGVGTSDVTTTSYYGAPTFLKSDNTPVESVVTVPIPVVSSRTYKVTFNAKVSGGTGYVALCREDNDSVISSYSTITNTELESQELNISNYSYTGNAYLRFCVSNSPYTITVNEVYIKCPDAFVPQAIVDWLTGYAHFSGDRVRFNPDGSGHLANKNISWNEQGDAVFNGVVNANMIYTDSYNIDPFITTYTVFIDGQKHNIYKCAPSNRSLAITLPSAYEYSGLELRFLCTCPENPYKLTINGDNENIRFVDDGGYSWAASQTSVKVKYDCLVVIQSIDSAWVVVQGVVTYNN